jgi:hypothetical protein
MQKTTKLPGNARWIGDRRRATKGEPPCPYLRNSFALPGPVRRATLQWTALGVADLFLNGRKVGEDFLMPGWSDFRKRAQVMSADVTAMLRPGDNADPDGDGLSNMREYAFGGNPVAPDTEAWLVSQDAANLVFSWLQRADGSVSYTLLEHGDLVAGPWLPSVVPIEPATGPAPPPGYGWVRISVPSAGKKFFRVQATKSQP